MISCGVSATHLFNVKSVVPFFTVCYAGVGNCCFVLCVCWYSLCFFGRWGYENVKQNEELSFSCLLYTLNILGERFYVRDCLLYLLLFFSCNSNWIHLYMFFCCCLLFCFVFLSVMFMHMSCPCHPDLRMAMVRSYLWLVFRISQLAHIHVFRWWPTNIA